ncbi:MAG: AMP-binding protein [Chloroflexi bacterium]|nr:AMP-binding protein [Chloroflexota bacterium]
MPTLPSVLLHHAETIPDQLFTRILKKGVVEKTRTFAEAWEWAAQWAALYAERGIRRGDAVMLALPNCDAFAGAFFGALMLGAVPAPVAPLRRLNAEDSYLATLVQRIRFLDAKAVVVPPEHTDTLSLPVSVLSESQVDPHSSFILHPSSFPDLGLIQFTSGTAGHAKAVMLSQRALLAQTEMLKQTLRLYDRFADWAVSWLPLFHDMGLIGFLLTPAYTGGSVTLLPAEEFVLHPNSWLKALTDTRATITGGPPSAYALCARRTKDADVANYSLGAVRVALVGAEAVTRESMESFAKKFGAAGFRRSSLMPTYGLAECSLAVTMPPLDTGPEWDTVEAASHAEGVAQPVKDETSAPRNVRYFAAVGVPMPETSVAIVNETGERLPERRVGEIIINSPSLMNGYWGGEGDALREGWLWTGDVGYVAGGKLFITGRKKEVIIVGGRNFYPDDVEQTVSAVRGVRAERVVAVGVEDAGRGTEALVVLAETDPAEPVERDALRLAIRRALLAAGFPVSEVVLLKPKSIQSTLTGKLKRQESKARYLAGEFGA